MFNRKDHPENEMALPGLRQPEMPRQGFVFHIFIKKVLPDPAPGIRIE